MDPQLPVTLLIVAAALYYLYRTVRPRRAPNAESDCAPGCASGCAGCSIAAEMRRDGQPGAATAARPAPPSTHR